MSLARCSFEILAPFVRGLFAIGVLTLAAASAHATEPAMVRVRLHTREEAHASVTFVDIAVQGTEAPIRLLRRVEGSCAVASVDVAPALVRVECASSLRFEVAHERGEIVVRRTAPADSDASVDGMIIIARAVLPPHTAVLLEPTGS